MRRRAAIAVLMAVAVMVTMLTPAGAAGVGVISKKNMEWVFNYPAAVGSDIEFYEQRQEDGSLKRYAIYGSMGNGFNIVEITDPELPILTGVFVDPGVNWQGDIQINPRRHIAVLATQATPGTVVGCGTALDGLAFVDIEDPSQPTFIGRVCGLASAAHNSTIIDDEIIYTTGSARMVDYSDPANPIDRGQISGPRWDTGANVNMCSGHDITVDPNRPHIIYNACGGGGGNTQIWDVTDSRNPVWLSTIPGGANGLTIAHQADPNPDSTLLFVTDERGGGLTNVSAPGGGIHVFDISGKYTAPNANGPASLTNPIRVTVNGQRGGWWPPFNGVATSPTQSGPWGNVTAHNMTFQAERHLLSIGWYTMGSWVTDLQEATNHTGPYEEWSGTHALNGGPTTWGNTQGNILLEGAETWSAKWTRFDDPKFDRYVFTSDISRGFDVLRYTGGMPKKVARLAVDDEAAAGVVTGVLDRYAVYTYEGYVNKPLEDKAISVRVGGQTVSATTDEDGGFSAELDLAPGTHEVVVTWAGDGLYQPVSVTQTITV